MDKIKALILGIFLVAVLQGSASPAFADEVLFFSPTRVNLSEASPVETITISNLSDIARAYVISVEDLIMTPQGVTAPVEHFDYSAKRMVRFVPREFVLKPGEKQTLRIMARTGPDTAAGEYHSHLRFLEDVTRREEINPAKPQGAGALISAPLAYEALIPVVVSHGDVTTTIGLKDADIQKAAPGAGYKVTLHLTREGNGQGTAYIDTSYAPPGGAPVTATTRRTIHIYRELGELQREYEFGLPENLPGGGTITVSVYDDPTEGAQPADQVTLPLPE